VKEIINNLKSNTWCEPSSYTTH